MHEILTVQLGTQANYVGTHFWNTQEKYFTYGSEELSPVDHDIHFRAGQAPNGAETFSPRALIYDLKENFGALKKAEGSYEEVRDETGGIWPNSSTLQTGPSITQHPYIDSLASQSGPSPTSLTAAPPRYFTDFSHPYYHPRSILPLPRSVLPTPSHLNPLRTFASGAELFADLNTLESDTGDLFERDVRWWIEECDNLQGVSLVTSVDDAWGGFTAAWAEKWRDEIGGGKGVWVWGVEGARAADSQTREAKMRSRLNSTQALSAIAQHASLYIPLTVTPKTTPSYLKIDASSSWHVSALQSTAIETASLPTRLRSNASSRRGLYQDLEEIVSGGGNRRVAKLEASIRDAEELADELDARERRDKRQINGTSGRHVNGVTNGMDINDDQESFEKLDLDLFSRDVLGSARPTTREGQEHVFGRAEVARGAWGMEERTTEGEDRWSGPIVERFQTSLTVPHLTSFPPILSFPSNQRFAVHTALSSSSAVARQIRQAEQTIRRFVGVDEREALCDGLKTLCEEYEEGWDSGSDEGDDD